MDLRPWSEEDVRKLFDLCPHPSLFGLISSMLLFCTVRHKRTSHTYKSYDPHS